MKKLPAGWNEDKIEQVIDHHETQSEDEAVAEDGTILAPKETLMQIPIELVGDVRALIAKGRAKH